MNKEAKNNYELVAQLESEGKEIFKSVKIKSDEDLAQVSDKVKELKTRLKMIEEKKEAFVGPAKLIIAEAKNIFDEAIAWFKNAEKELKGKASAYMLEKERINREKEAKIAKDLEAGKIDTDKAISKLEKLPETSKSVNTGESKMQMRKIWNAYIVDPKQIPDEFWVIDESRVKREAKERHKNGLPQIPGVEMREEASIASL